MSIDIKYVALYELQQYFVNKTTGNPLSSGVVTFYEDENRTVKKNIFQITGSMGNYNFVTLPNPLTLSSVGTPVDGSGNDIIIYGYPYDIDGNTQLYYITITSSVSTGLIPQFTREAIPSGIVNQSGPTSIDNFNNLIINGSFLFNIGQVSNPGMGFTQLAPSSHQGLIQPDICIFKDQETATDSITFVQNFNFGPMPIPTYSLFYNCTNFPSSEINKFLYIPLTPNVIELSDQIFTLSFWAKSISAASITFQFYQFFGQGGGSAAVTTTMDTFVLTSTATMYSIIFGVPSINGKTIGDCGDDYAAIFIRLPINTQTDVTLTNLQLLDGNRPLVEYIYQPPQMVAGQVFTPRTGDTNTSIRRAIDPSWVLMNDGTIGNSSSGATTRAYVDTFPLYLYIWNTISNIWAPIYTSTGVPSTRGISAAADFSANKQLSLTKALGRVLAGVNPPLPGFLQTFTRSSDNLLVTATAKYYVGQQVTVSTTGTLPAPLTANTIYYVTNILSNTAIQLAADLENSYLGIAISLTTAGTGVQTVRNYLGTGIFNRKFIATSSSGLLLTLDDASELFQGVTVQVYPGNGGVLPTGLTAGVTYYILQGPLPNTTYLTATYGGAAIGFTNAGTTPNFLTTVNMATVIGQTDGQEQHILRQTELPSVGVATVTSAVYTAGNAGGIGSNQPFNEIQPTTYMNIYMKL